MMRECSIMINMLLPSELVNCGMDVSVLLLAWSSRLTVLDWPLLGMFERRMIMRKEFQLAKESTSSAYEWGGREYVEGSIKIKLLEELQAT
jgi:hypothetical protein